MEEVEEVEVEVEVEVLVVVVVVLVVVLCRLYKEARPKINQVNWRELNQVLKQQHAFVCSMF